MNTAETLIYLTACSLNNVAAKLDEADWDFLYCLSKGHNMSAITANSLIKTKAFENADESTKKKWTQMLNGAIKRTMLFNAERNKICTFLEERGIRHIPLKGAVLNDMYPCFGTREFADNDILYDGKYSEDVKEWMTSQGYTMRNDSYVADEYSKPPLYNFEMHSRLFRAKKANDPRLAFYERMLERKIPEKGKQFSFRMSNEDFYIYFIIHAFKHYDSRGTGFRTVADEYVILHCDKLSFDRGLVDDELEKLGLTEFERTLCSLAEKLFKSPESLPGAFRLLSDDEREMLNYVFTCGTFGKMDNMFKKELESVYGDKNASKGKYYLKRIFPGVSRYRYTNPFVYKHKIVYPFFWLYRTAVYPIAHRSQLKREINAIKRINKDSNDEK